MVAVAACRVAVDVDDADKTRLVAEAFRDAAHRGARLVVPPELALCGALFESASEATSRAEQVEGPSVRFLAELSRAYGLVLVAGFCEESGLERPYNNAVVLDAGEVLAVYRETHLWDFEHELFTPGPSLPPGVTTSIGPVSPLICYDPRNPGDAALRRAPLRADRCVASELARL